MKLPLKDKLSGKNLYMAFIHIALLVLVVEVLVLTKQSQELRMMGSPREPVQVGSPFVLGQLLPANVNADIDTTRPLLVYVFSTRCGYCVKNLPAWAALADSAVSRGIGTMAISTDSVATAAAYIAKHSIRYAVYVATDGREFMVRNGIQFVPQTILRDREGRASAVWPGELSSSAASAIQTALRDYSKNNKSQGNEPRTSE